LIKNILTADILPIPKHYSQDMKTMVESLLKKDPNLRPSVCEILSLPHIIEKMKKLEFTYDSNHSSSPVSSSGDFEVNYNIGNNKLNNIVNDNSLIILEELKPTFSEQLNINDNGNIKFSSKIFNDSNKNLLNSNTKLNANLSNNNSISSNNSTNLTKAPLPAQLNKNQFSFPELRTSKESGYSLLNISPDKLSIEESKI
jgi:hypothetical protein